MVLAGQDDVVFGTVLLGRMNAGAGADRVPGLYMNTLPVRVRDAETTVVDALDALRSQLAALLAHEHAPLLLAQLTSGVPDGLPLFTTLLNYRHSRRAPRIPDVRTQGDVTIVGSEERSNYPLDVSVDDWGTGLGVTVNAAAPADPGQLCALVCTCLDGLVTALETAPGTPLRAIPVLDPAERAQLVDGWNDTAAPVPDVTVAELFRQQVARTPDAVAVACEGAFLSYGELDRRASRLAGTLTGRYAGREPTVAVLADRSAGLVIALLAVLKSGAAYLPVHPGTPTERVTWMLADAGVQILLADRDQDQPGNVVRLPVAGARIVGD
ncbi:MAG: AMP-binding protein, partial [Streptosporangiaceae bacterium]